MSRRAVYTGSFDPITLGHLNVIERSSRLVDELIVGIGTNIEKQPLFTVEERWRKSSGRPGRWKCFRSTVCGAGRSVCPRVPGARYVRGVRSLSDMDTEFTMTLANRKLDPSIETVFAVWPDEEFSARFPVR